ncbi:MAG TPA: hypothetical protein PLD96_03155 [Methanothrix sp.]|nr:hypothetical protein [Methanothrix sp.]
MEGSEDEAEGLDEMLPGGLCHYDGPEADLPVGGYSKLPGWGPEKAARRWLVASPETELGYIEKKTRELSPDDFIIGVELHEGILGIYAETYGPKFYLIRGANGGPLMTRQEWQQQFGTDGLALVAIRNKRQELAGKRKIISI